MDRIFRVVSMAVHLIAALALTLLSCAFIVEAVYQTVVVVVAGGGPRAAHQGGQSRRQKPPPA